ncbi:MAG TPA: sugar ABC transporter permease [Thermoanaerobaculia bacterium]|nr:sugar ABC transporter permease [Thermoanaerobaculia bacterium]
MRSDLAAEARAAFWFLTPALALIFVFFVLPIVAAFALSLTDFDLYALADPANVRLVGFANYSRLLADPLFWKALGNTFYFALGAGVLSVAVGLGGALAVNSRLTRLQPLWRTLFFAPYVTTLVAVAVVWRYFYQPRFGLLARLSDLVGLPQIDWLGDPRFAMPAIILLAVWKGFGYNLILFIAGLRAIPESLYEAAAIDGASPWDRLRHFTLPMLAPTFFFVATVTTIGSLQLFAEPYVMTRGGNPMNATLSVVLLMFKEGFRWWNLGYAAAVAFVLFAVVLLVTLAQSLILRPRRA